MRQSTSSNQVLSLKNDYQAEYHTYLHVLTELPDRVPFPDWLEDCETGTFREFTNRTVVGSMFILVLNDKLMEHRK